MTAAPSKHSPITPPPPPGGSSLRGHNHHGHGGTNFASGLQSHTEAAVNRGPGVLYIVRAVRGDCGCDHLCLYLDEREKTFTCICQEGFYLHHDDKTCVSTTSRLVEKTWQLFVVLGVVSAVVLTSVGISCGMKTYRKKQNTMNQDHIINEISSMIAIKNPSTAMMQNLDYDISNPMPKHNTLNTICKDNVMLVKCIGKGCFGQVYQGYLTQTTADTVKQPVAVKVLKAEASTADVRESFMLEANIVAQFAHPNIVRFIGIVNERNFQYIILELLAGGDLGVFLKTARPTQDKPKSITTRDLLKCAYDVSKGCAHLESKLFVHRDIAARNCLLTTVGPGRTVKIADFGLARDIYRSEYYRKEKHTKVPVKWMAPESFQENFYTVKSDVWSYGVLLWEIFTCGYSPYAHQSNVEVMEMVGKGVRLQSPCMCPPPIYSLMTDCWKPAAGDRPSFADIMAILAAYLQDAKIYNTPLPQFEPVYDMGLEDTLPIQPCGMDDNWFTAKCADSSMENPNSIGSEEYLMPLPASGSLLTVKSDMISSPSLDSGPDRDQMGRLLQDVLCDDNDYDTRDLGDVPQSPNDFETSFILSQSSVKGPSNRNPHSRTNFSSKSQKRNQARECQEWLLTPIERQRSKSSSPKLNAHRKASNCSSNSLSMLKSELLKKVEDESTVPPEDPESKKDPEEPRYSADRFSAFANSEKSSSSTTSSSSTSSSINGAGNSGASTASTLPLHPSTLPPLLPIPPPIQYINLDVKKRPPPEIPDQAYVIPETREHREISC